MNSTGFRVFLAAPYSQWLDPSTGLVDVQLRERLERLRLAFLDCGAHVFNAHHNEDWGANWLPADECTPADFHAMRAADAVCAVIGSPLSGGVAVELGWASALGKPVLVVAEEGATFTPMIQGLHTVTQTTFITTEPEWTDAFIDKVIEATLAPLQPTSARPDPSVLGYVLAAGS